MAPRKAETKPLNKRLNYADRAKLAGKATKTFWRHENGGRTRQDQARDQQNLTPQEEKALIRYILRCARNGYPLPVKALRSLAAIIKSRRKSNSQTLSAEDLVKPPGPNWPSGFYKRHPDLTARRVKPLH